MLYSFFQRNRFAIIFGGKHRLGQLPDCSSGKATNIQIVKSMIAFNIVSLKLSERSGNYRKKDANKSVKKIWNQYLPAIILSTEASLREKPDRSGSDLETPYRPLIQTAVNCILQRRIEKPTGEQR